MHFVISWNAIQSVRSLKDENGKECKTGLVDE